MNIKITILKTIRKDLENSYGLIISGNRKFKYNNESTNFYCYNPKSNNYEEILKEKEFAIKYFKMNPKVKEITDGNIVDGNFMIKDASGEIDIIKPLKC